MKNYSYIWISFIVLVFGIIVVPEVVAKIKNRDMPVAGIMPEFNLVNQYNERISNKNYEGKVYIVEFFFSTCPTICPVMNKNMKQIQDEFFAYQNFGIASFTIDPKHDTPEVLLEHAKEIGAEHQNWNFLTGDKQAIYSVAEKIKLFVGENPNVAGGFEHSGAFVLVDKEGNIRSRTTENGSAIYAYDGLEPTGIKMLKEDIAILLKE